VRFGRLLCSNSALATLHLHLGLVQLPHELVELCVRISSVGFGRVLCCVGPFQLLRKLPDAHVQRSCAGLRRLLGRAPTTGLRGLCSLLERRHGALGQLQVFCLQLALRLCCLPCSTGLGNDLCRLLTHHLQLQPKPAGACFRLVCLGPGPGLCLLGEGLRLLHPCLQGAPALKRGGLRGPAFRKFLLSGSQAGTCLLHCSMRFLKLGLVQDDPLPKLSLSATQSRP